jgi:hypothetical protein
LEHRVANFVAVIFRATPPADLPDRRPRLLQVRHQPEDGKGPEADDPAVADEVIE